jgi:pimeloyl-ACP methyl ester carboxylesterase
MLYVALSFSERGVADDVLETDAGVSVFESERSITFIPRRQEQRSALLFVPGGMVDPHAYAPLLRRVAESGHAAVLVRLPSLGGRHAMGESGRQETVRRARSVMENAPDRSWIVAGHSLGGHLAARVVHGAPDLTEGLVLIGTTHPRDISLADYARPVVKIYGTRDRIAPLERSRQNAANIPAATEWVAIEGGNHSQFGYYGFQLGDGRARITREQQQDQVLQVLLEALAGGVGRPAGDVQRSR